MRSRTFILSLGIILAGACVVLLPAHAQDRRSAPGQAKHIVYVVKLGSAKDIAAVLARQFQGDAEVDVLPDSNCLLIRANASVFDDVVKTLQVLDRRPRLVTVEVWVADVVSPKAEKGEEPKLAPIDDSALTGPSGAVLVRLREMQRKGQLGSLKRLQTTVAENQSASIMEGETKPYVTGSTVTATGRTSRMISYRNTGTNARCTPRVADDETVMLDLKVEDARMHVPEDGVVLGEDDKGKVRATEFITASYTGTVNIGPGRAVLLRDVKMDSKKAGPDRTLVVVTARVSDPDAKPAEAKPADTGERPRGGLLPPQRPFNGRPPFFIGRDPPPPPYFPPWRR
jgi:hypothetical protein